MRKITLLFSVLAGCGLILSSCNDDDKNGGGPVDTTIKLSIGLNSLEINGDDTSTKLITVSTSASGYTADITSGDWITVDRQSDYFTVEATSVNPSTEESRQAEVTVKDTDGGEKIFTIVQDKSEEEETATGSGDAIVLKPSVVNFRAGSSEARDVEVVLPGSLTFNAEKESSATWLNVTQEGNYIRLKPDELGTKNASRKADVTVTAGGLTATLTVTQEGPINTVVESVLGDWTVSMAIPVESSTYQYTFSTTLKYDSANDVYIADKGYYGLLDITFKKGADDEYWLIDNYPAGIIDGVQYFQKIILYEIYYEIDEKTGKYTGKTDREKCRYVYNATGLPGNAFTFYSIVDIYGKENLKQTRTFNGISQEYGEAVGEQQYQSDDWRNYVGLWPDLQGDSFMSNFGFIDASGNLPEHEELTHYEDEFGARRPNKPSSPWGFQIASILFSRDYPG